jgi:hypothetical protein
MILVMVLPPVPNMLFIATGVSRGSDRRHGRCAFMFGGPAAFDAAAGADCLLAAKALAEQVGSYQQYCRG